MPLLAPVALMGAAGVALWSFVGPRKQLGEAEAEEQVVLTRAGVPTYLSFHMRRIDATIDPNARERLHLAALEHRVALSHWQELAGDLGAADALALEKEVRRYVAGARRRDQARVKGRKREDVEAEPSKLEAQARRMHRPEWGAAVEPSDADEPDVQELLRRRHVAAQAYETAETLVPDVEHLADR